jgi:hypothetical protein
LGKSDCAALLYADRIVSLDVKERHPLTNEFRLNQKVMEARIFRLIFIGAGVIWSG